MNYQYCQLVSKDLFKWSKINFIKEYSAGNNLNNHIRNKRFFLKLSSSKKEINIVIKILKNKMSNYQQQNQDIVKECQLKNLKNTNILMILL